ncbi:MAG TPA: hypothetical protein ENI52_01875 [Thermoplasmata archaeon]|nr:hypothetical protein [Thermoplasmata archaeon]
MKSILIGIDGAEPKLIDKWIDELPNLQKFYSCYGKLKSTLPPSSAPAWTSIVTGVTPPKHGIYDFFYFDGNIKIVSSRSRKKPAIWNLLSRIGRKSIVINVPVTYPPERINGVVVSGLLTPPGENFVMPLEARKFLLGYKMEHLIIDDLPIRIASYYNPEKVIKILNEWIESRTRAGVALMKNFEWDFSMIVYRATDLVQHFLWNREEVFEIYKKVDEEVGKIMENFRANYFIVSDHGFYGIRRNIFLNNLLYQKGFVYTSKEEKRLKIGKKLTKILSYMPKNFTHIPSIRKMLFSIAFKKNSINFEKSTAFCLSSSSRAIICKKEVKEEIMRLVNNFECEDKKIMKAHEIYEDDKKVYIIIELQEGYAIVDILNFERIVDKPERFHFKGEHGKNGVFMAHGKNIKEWNGRISVIDVLPTIFHSMNIEIPDYIEGKTPDLFKKKLKEKRVEWEKYGISEKEMEKIKKIAKSGL